MDWSIKRGGSGGKSNNDGLVIIAGGRTHFLVHLPPILPAENFLGLLVPLSLGYFAREHLQQSVGETFHDLINPGLLQQLFVLRRDLAQFVQLLDCSNISTLTLTKYLIAQ